MGDEIKPRLLFWGGSLIGALGVLDDVTGGWALPLALLFIGLAIAVAAGLRAALPRFVDDEMAPSAA